MGKQMGPLYAPSDYAGFIRRSLAIAFDSVLLWAIYAAAPWAWYYTAPNEWLTDQAYGRVATGAFLFSIAYMIGLRFTENGTLGYRLLRIRYASVLDKPATPMSRAFRALVALVLLMFFAMDHFWILFDKRKQAWHDKVSGFYVVKRAARPIGTVPVTQRVVGIFGLTFIILEPIDDEDGGRSRDATVST